MFHQQNKKSNARVFMTSMMLLLLIVIAAPLVSQAQGCQPRGPVTFTFKNQNFDQLPLADGQIPLIFFRRSSS